MATYCKLALKVDPELDVQETFSLFAIEHYSARQAVQIDSTQFVVDNDMNDLKAVLKPEEGFITFCCRYEQDIARTEAKVLEFSQKHNFETGSYMS